MKSMIQLLQRMVWVIMIASMASCSKSDGGSGGGGGTPPPPAEAKLVIALNPDPGAGIVPVLSDNYPFKLLINSVPPANGVKIEISATRETDNVVQISQASQTNNSTINSVDLQLNSLVAGIVYVVKLTVSSQSNASNTASITFRVARK